MVEADGFSFPDPNLKQNLLTLSLEVVLFSVFLPSPMLLVQTLPSIHGWSLVRERFFLKPSSNQLLLIGAGPSGAGGLPPTTAADLCLSSTLRGIQVLFLLIPQKQWCFTWALGLRQFVVLLQRLHKREEP